MTTAGKTLPKPGDRIELVAMPDDPHPVAVGTKGTVQTVTPEVDQIGVKWDDGSTLFLIISVDRWRNLTD